MLTKSWPWVAVVAAMALTWWWIGDSATRASQARLAAGAFAGVALAAVAVVFAVKRGKSRSED